MPAFSVDNGTNIVANDQALSVGIGQPIFTQLGSATNFLMDLFPLLLLLTLFWFLRKHGLSIIAGGIGKGNSPRKIINKRNAQEQKTRVNLSDKYKFNSTGTPVPKTQKATTSQIANDPNIYT